MLNGSPLSDPDNVNTCVRGLIAAVVVLVSLWLTMFNANMSSEWEAVLLTVIGYYFKDRPQEESLSTAITGTTDEDRASLVGAKFEMSLQFVLALLLIGCTAIAFVLPTPKDSISGAWIAAVVLAIGFYFKESSSQLMSRHTLYRTFIASSS